MEERLNLATLLFDYTGGVQTWTVPANVTSAIFDVYGAQGAAGGGQATATLALTPGETLAIYVGGAASGTTGGFNGGGNAGSSINPGSGGGGGSDIRRDANTNTIYELTERILVAGGGGGAGGFSGGAGGAGGGLNGGNGDINFFGTGGGGGTQSAGGAGGGGGGAGGLGFGGTGESAGGIDDSGGGGGGGYYGGGGGSADLRGGGGGGGSGFGPTGTIFSSGVRSGNGQIVIKYNFAPVLAGANNLTDITVNNTNNTGTAVSALVSGQITDPDSSDPQGFAITNTNSTNGTWQYSTDSGTNWTNVGSVSNSSALLLTANAGTRVRFVPNANFIGAVNNGLTFHAWDQFTGTEGTKVDVSSTGGATAFSTAPASSSINVTEIPSFVVTTNSDVVDAFDGLTSLREAISYANSKPGADTITFGDGTATGGTNFLDGIADTITLTLGQLDITSSLTITGQGADKTIIDGGWDGVAGSFVGSRIMRLADGDNGITQTVTITGVTLQYANAGYLDFAQSTGGAIWNFEQLNLSDSRIVNNMAYGGAGIENHGTVTSTNNTFALNIAFGDFGAGGGVANGSGATFTSTGDAFTNNTAPNYIGGAVMNSGTFSLINGTMANNSAGTAGGVFNQGTFTSINATIAKNTASSGAGIFNQLSISTWNSVNTVVAGNTGGDVFLNGVPVINAEHTLIGDNTLSGTGITNNVTYAAIFGTNLLANNGGPTQTIALVAGSPAINAGNNALAVDANNQPLTTDQRGTGFPRIIGGTVDIGALEFPATAPTVTAPTATNIALTTATLGGTVTGDGGAAISERGIVFSVTSLNNNPQLGGTAVVNVTTAGTTGVFTIDVTMLPTGTQISYAAYATNSVGTTYSTVSTFTTQPAIGQFPGITVQILGGQMIVTGTEQDDTIKVASDGMGGYIVTANKLINGLPSPQSFSGATSFVANTLGGHDDLWLAAPLTLDSVTVDLGNGNDRLVLGADPNNAINNNVLDPQFGTLGYLTVNGPVSVIGGEGNDRVLERSTNINGVKTINLGEGNNEYNVYWGFSNETIFSSGAGTDNVYIGYLSSREASQFDTGAGNDLISYYASRFYKTAYLNSGAGADTVALDVNIYDEATTVDTGSEADYLLFSRSVAYKSVVLTTAAGADTVLIGKYISGLGSNGAPIYSNGGSSIDDLTLNTGVEADTVQVAANVMRMFFANLGDAYDDAEVEFNLFTDGFLDGGGQDMRLRLRGNAGLRTRNPG